MSRLASVIGIGISALLLLIATALHPGGFDWNRDFISTMLRSTSGRERYLADFGVLLFCLSNATIFVRLSGRIEFSQQSRVIQIGGVGAMVYSGLTITPIHDLMVTISIGFILVAGCSLASCLFSNRMLSLFLMGCTCIVLLIASAILYYTGQFGSILPWAQRLSYLLFAAWIISIDWSRGRPVAYKSQ